MDSAVPVHPRGGWGSNPLPNPNPTPLGVQSASRTSSPFAPPCSLSSSFVPVSPIPQVSGEVAPPLDASPSAEPPVGSYPEPPAAPFAGLSGLSSTELPAEHLQDSSLPGSSLQTSFSITPTRRPTRHLNTSKKLKEWSLCIRKKVLILGDSNLSKVPPFNVPDLQVDSYPGATFHHAEALLRKAICTADPETIVLSLGLNNRRQKTRETTIKQLQATMRVAKHRFPDCSIRVPLINFSSALPQQERLNLQILNNHIMKHYDYIPQLPNRDFHTEPDRTHWTHHTASKMFTHWLNQVN
ncbi:uncharacterized protein V6R79_021697 [Siganus canaliculatus]